MDDSNSALQLTIQEDDLSEFKRLDQFLAAKLPDFSRTFIKKLFLNGDIFLVEGRNNKKFELKKMPALGSVIEINVPPPAPVDAIPQNIPLKVLFEDQYLIIFNKPAGIVVHPAPGHPDGTLVNALLYHCKDLQGVGNERRPGIVHRLDKGTSGVMVAAKEQKTHEELVLLFSKHEIKRQYWAIVLGKRLGPSGTLKSLIGRHPNHRQKMSSNPRSGKEAITHFEVKEYLGCCALVECTLETGRTHQIRVHLSELENSPILMDPVYGRPIDNLNRLPHQISSKIKDYPHPFLHARVLGFKHPRTGEELYFESEPPPIFCDTLELLRHESANL